MGLLRNLAVVTGLLAVGSSLFVRWVMMECKGFSIPSQEGKIFIVTGSNTGLGYHTALDIAKAGGSVVMGVRSVSKGEEAKKSILQVVPTARLEVMQLDLGSFQSIRAFAKKFTSLHSTFDVLVNNAGISGPQSRLETADGLEMTIGVNHLGPFLLTSLLLPHLKSNGRIVNHSSFMYHLAFKSFLEDLQSKNRYHPTVAYSSSKAANLMFTYMLRTRLQAVGNPRNITVVAVHPGLTSTTIMDTAGDPLGHLFNNVFGMSTADGSQSLTLAATSSNIGSSDGTYLGPKYFGFGPPHIASTNSLCSNEDNQVLLWEQSEKLTGATFRFT